MDKYPQAYIDYLLYFHGDRDYFECHEVLEEYWKANLQDGQSHAWVGLIQVAVAMYHHRRSNLNGAVKMLTAAIDQLSRADLAALGIDQVAFLALLQKRLEQLTSRPDDRYEDISFPFLDQQLLAHCKQLCAEKQKNWAMPSDLHNEMIIHKHRLRDRSSVIQTRLAEWKRKQQLRAEKRDHEC